jgi:predicted ribosome quality control (RQC) complex YloA/Tae2 family protein
MSLRPPELSAIGAELDRELRGAVIQKVHAPSTSRLYAELRAPGRSVTLLFCSEAQVARVSAVEERPPNPPAPPAWQSVLRAQLIGAKAVDFEVLPAHRTLLVHLAKGETRRTLVLEVGAVPGLALLSSEARVLALSAPFRSGFRVGSTWALSEFADVKATPSRLSSDHAFLRLAHGAEQLFTSQERERSLRSRREPLVARLSRLLRTQEKVQADADRSERGEVLRREGELLRHQVHRLERGVRSVTLPEYLPDGEVREVTVALDPKRTPREEVEWRFHQYRRLKRGADLAKERLAQLAREEAALRAELSVLEASAPQALVFPVQRERLSDSRSSPYREYTGSGGGRIWVGRGALHNDALTFHEARPHHVWLHARGVPGAHVVIPLEKRQVVSSELLVDAAHLALHHSDLKGEPRGEISHTQVKFVRKARAAAPGAVTYTREKTMMLRVEPARLQRLLASAGGDVAARGA